MTMSVAAFVSLVKPRIVALLSLTGTTALLAAGGTTSVATVAFVVAGACIAGGAATLNCWYDRDIDAEMTRTRDRPLPSAALAPRTALAFAGTLLGSGTLIGVAVLPIDAVAYMWGGAAAYVGLYTAMLKRRSRAGVVLGGSAGAFPVLAGWATAESLSLAPVLVAGLVFVWTPAHAWALAVVYRTDFAAAGVPTLPAVTPPARTAWFIWTAAITTAVYAVVLVTVLPPVYAVTCLVTTPLFVVAYYEYYRRRTRATAVRAFFTSNTYLAVLFLSWAVPSRTVTLVVTPVAAAAAILAVWYVRPSLGDTRAAPLRLDEPEHLSVHAFDVIRHSATGTRDGDLDE